MVDRDKVINGLYEALRVIDNSDAERYMAYSAWAIEDAIELLKAQELCADAVSREAAIKCCTFGRTSLGLIDELRRLPSARTVSMPRVMTIGDLYGEDMGYYERKDEELVWPVLIARGGPDEDGTVGIVRKDAFEIKADCGLANITWRIWTAFPTMAQREATKWNE